MFVTRVAIEGPTAPARYLFCDCIMVKLVQLKSFGYIQASREASIILNKAHLITNIAQKHPWIQIRPSTGTLVWGMQTNSIHITFLSGYHSKYGLVNSTELPHYAPPPKSGIGFTSDPDKRERVQLHIQDQ